MCNAEQTSSFALANGSASHSEMTPYRITIAAMCIGIGDTKNASEGNEVSWIWIVRMLCEVMTARGYSSRQFVAREPRSVQYPPSFRALRLASGPRMLLVNNARSKRILAIPYLRSVNP